MRVLQKERRYSETFLQRNLDGAKFCVWRITFTVLRILNLEQVNILKRNLSETEKSGPMQFHHKQVSLQSAFSASNPGRSPHLMFASQK